MKLLRRLWHELVKERGPSSHRFYRVSKRSRSGVALLVTLTSILFLTVVMTEIVYGSSIRLKQAANNRDEAKAEALAYTGYRMYRLVIMSARQLDGTLSQFGMSGDLLLDMIPMINTNLLRMVLVSGGSADEDDVEEFAEEGLTEEERVESREESASGTGRNFLDFDGDFFAEVVKEDTRINVASLTGETLPDLQMDPHAIQLHALMTGVNRCDTLYSQDVSYEDLEDNTRFFYDRNLEPWELIGNLKDWTDVDTTRVYLGGDEDSIYDRLDDPYDTKNAPFDTLEELRLVEGWHRDDIWARFGEHLTVYGSGKVNIAAADCDVMWALTKSYIEPTPNDETVLLIMREVQEYKTLIGMITAAQFETILGNYGTVKPELKSQITDKSSVFRIRSVGEVGESTAIIEAVVDFSNSSQGQVLYWRVR